MADYLIIEFEEKLLSFFLIKEEANNYFIASHYHMPITTEFLDATIYHHPKLRLAITQAVSFFNLNKPQTLLYFPALQKVPTHSLPFHTLQAALCFFSTPTRLNYILPYSLQPTFYEKDQQALIPQDFLAKASQNDVLKPFKYYNQHHPTLWLSLTGGCAILLMATFYMIQTRSTQTLTHSQLAQTILKKQNTTIQKEISLLEHKITLAKDTIKKASIAQQKTHLATLPYLLLSTIEKTIPSDTFLTSLNFLPYNKNKSTSLSPSKKIRLNGTSFTSTSVIKFFTLLEKTSLFKQLGIKTLTKDKNSDFYLFEMYGILTKNTLPPAKTIQ